MTAPRISERPERPDALIVEALNGRGIRVPVPVYHRKPADAFMNHQAAEIARQAARITELEAGREAFARECMIKFRTVQPTRLRLEKYMTFIIAAVKAREGK